MAFDQDSASTTIAPGVDLPDAALRFSFARGSGPGGQNVNKTATAATLTVRLEDLAGRLHPAAVRRLRAMAGRWFAEDPDRLVIPASDSRSQLANRKACLAKLRRLVVQASRRPTVRKKTRPSRGAKRRRLEAKKQQGQRKQRRRIDRDPGQA